jgi:hypothetical protein
MAHFGVGAKYHIALGLLSSTNQAQSFFGYLLRGRGYSKTDAKIFAPRFGTGEQGLNDLDIFKSWAQSDWSGGSFQEAFSDPASFSLLQNALLNKFNKLLYPTKSQTALTFPGGMRNNRRYGIMYKNEFYIISNGAGVTGPGFGAVAKLSGTTFTNVKNDFATAVSSVAVLNNLLWVATSGGVYWMYDGTTWTAGGAAYFTAEILQPYNGKMYAGDTGVNAGRLTSHDGTNMSGATTFVGTPGDINKPINCLLEFNHRLYIGKADGLYAYDGVQISCILDYSTDYDARNFKWLVQLNGIMYFTLKNCLYQFNGATVELVRDFSQYERINGLSVAYGRLWVMTSTIIAPLGMGASTAQQNFFYYDGTGWFCYDQSHVTQDGLDAYQVFYDGTNLLFFVAGSSGIADNTGYLVPLANEFLAGTSNTLSVFTSEFDANFPLIDKYLASVQVGYENLAVSDVITVKFRTFDGLTWSSYQTLGTINSASASGKLSTLDVAVSSLFKRLQIQVTLARTNVSGAALKSVNAEYLLEPTYKRQWVVSAICQGQSDQPLVLADNSTEETNTAKQLREQIYKCRDSHYPILFQDIDLTTLNQGGTLASGATTLTAVDTSTFPTAGYVQIDSEIIQYTGKTATTLTGLVRGKFGTSAATHVDASIINVVYRVVLSDVQNESVVSPAITDGVMDTYGNESEITFVLKEA